MLREGEGEPLVLFHGIICADRVWQHVIPHLATHHDVIAPSALGHRGGNAPPNRPATFEAVIDDAERLLDELELEKAHLAGNSLGGWVAIELARRGRATTVCALSPGGAWDRDWDGKDRERVFEILRTAVRETRRGRRLMPLLSHSARFRRWAYQEAAAHGDRVSRADMLAYGEDALGCTILEDLLADGSQLEPLDPAPCPITLAWSAEDHIFPVDLYGARAQDMIPGARFIVLDDVGHVPMYDDPKLVAETILATTAVPA